MLDPEIIEMQINMYFLEVKSTAHPPIIGALGHSTHFIGKQPNRSASLPQTVTQRMSPLGVAQWKIEFAAIGGKR